MVEKVRIKGDVGQIFNGNVINEAPQLSNVLNVNVAGDIKKAETLTQLQRRTIADLIDDLCAITGEEPLTVYRVILTDFGAAKMKLVPREEYPEIKKKISQWIVEAKRKNSVIDTEPVRVLNENQSRQSLQDRSPAIATDVCHTSTEGDISSSPKSTFNRQRTLPHVAALESPGECAVCVEKNVLFVRAQKTIRTLGTLVVVLVVLCGWFLYQMPPPGQNMTNYNCYFKGEPYSVGSIIKTGNGDLKECMSAFNGSSARWENEK
ncbi:UNVERIFIED_ORG: hypothetical protein DFO49_4060 [Herbaspirillum seropedicae]